MSKLVTIFLVLLLFESKGTFGELCGVSKSNNTCICKRVTDVATSSVITAANCANINVDVIPDPAELSPDVNLLDLSHNQLKTLDSNNTYSSVLLNTLILSYNNIDTIVQGCFDGLPNLEKLILIHNNITSLRSNTIFQNNKNLKIVDLSFNNIKTLDNGIFQSLVNLRILDLSYNDLALGGLLTSSSDFLHENLSIHENLEQLKLDKIGLKELHISYFKHFENLKHLSLADNHFKVVPVVPYSVEYLDLSGSDFTLLQAKNLSYHSLKILKLKRLNLLDNIHHYAFYNLQALEELYISDCRNLKEFNELVFGALSKNTVLPLKKLSLARNGLKGLNNTYKFLFNGMKLVDLTDNPWFCNCELLWFQEVDNFYKGDNIRCWTPNFLTTRRVFDLTTEDLPNCHPEKYGKRVHRILIPILILLVIVLAALIGYLIYYAPNLYNRNRSRGVGPQSPYNMARQEES